MTEKSCISNKILTEFDNCIFNCLNSVRFLEKANDLINLTIAGVIGSFLYFKQNGLFDVPLNDFRMRNHTEELMMSQLQFLDNSMIAASIRFFYKYSIDSDITKSLEPVSQYIAHLDIPDEQYGVLFDHALDRITSKARKYEGIHSQPKELGELANAIIGGNAKSVFDPFAGFSNFATSIEGIENFEGVEIDHVAHSISILRIALYGLDKKVSIERNDVSVYNIKKYDTIVTFQPLRMKMDIAPSRIFPEHTQLFSDVFAWRIFEDCTEYDGMEVSFVVPSTLFESSASAVEGRKDLLNKGFLHAVILLPKGLLKGTNIAIACVILKKHRNPYEPVIMVDASEFFSKHDRLNILDVKKVIDAYHNETKGVSCMVNNSDFDASCTWIPTRYIEMDEQDECPEGYTKRTIGEIASINAFSNFRENGQTGYMVSISNLSDDWYNCQIDKSKLTKDVVTSGYYKLVHNAVLVSSVQNLKPSLIQASEEEPVFIKRNIIALIPNPDIMPEYLCMSLAKLKVGFYGVAAPSVSITRLREEKVALPDYETQVSAYNEARGAALMAKAREMGFQEFFEQKMNEYVNEIRSRKHDMMPHLRQLSSACDNIDYYLSNKDSLSQDDFMNGMKEEVFNQKNAIDSLTTILKIFSREDKFGSPEVVNIDEFLMNHYFVGPNYQIDHDTDYKSLREYGFDIPDEPENPPYSIVDGKIVIEKGPEKDYVEGANVFIAKDDLQRLFDNIINNAVKHGFTDPNRGDYNITTDLSVVPNPEDPKIGMFQIDVTNNGNPLPKGLDKVRYGLKGEKAGVTAGTGEGGYIVKSIVEHYKGDYDIFSNKYEDSETTTVRVLLPIHTADE